MRAPAPSAWAPGLAARRELPRLLARLARLASRQGGGKSPVDGPPPPRLTPPRQRSCLRQDPNHEPAGTTAAFMSVYLF
jgi:hypothetical protein